MSLKLSAIRKEQEIKISVRIPESLDQDLADYALAYEAIYETSVEKEELVPLILRQFIDSDRKFKSWMKKKQEEKVHLVAEIKAAET